jgi:hypothetical protein
VQPGEAGARQAGLAEVLTDFFSTGQVLVAVCPAVHSTETVPQSSGESHGDAKGYLKCQSQTSQRIGLGLSSCAGSKSSPGQQTSNCFMLQRCLAKMNSPLAGTLIPVLSL